jgi:tRNA(fMet)-specific endonuclease VapC
VGTVLDTTIFVEIERATRGLPAARAMAEVAQRLEAQLGEREEVAIAAITASELLHGVHRATERHRGQREAFVEAVLAAFPVLVFDLLVARVHARLWAGLAAAGREVGAHDRLVAATALSAGWRVATANVRHLGRVPGLQLATVEMA